MLYVRNQLQSSIGLCAELWLMVFRRVPDGLTICGPRERRNVHNVISGTFQRAL